MNVSVLGAGMWGLAISSILANNGHNVYLWSNDKHAINNMKTKRKK